MKTQRFNRKVIISGSEVEYYTYKSKMQVRGYKRRKRKAKKVKTKEEKENPEKTKFAVNRARTQIRRLESANSDFDKFLTLTSKMTDFTKASRAFNLFTQKMKARFPEFSYLAVPEFQKDIDFFGKVKPDGGALHYHVVCKLPYIKNKTLEKIWGKGFVKIEAIKKNSKLGSYLCKYLQKEMFDKRMFGKKKYFCSQNIKRPVEIIGDDSRWFMRKNPALKFKSKMPFDNKYTGKVIYKRFGLKNITA